MPRAGRGRVEPPARLVRCVACTAAHYAADLKNVRN
jgi:hypothetical protein